MASFSCSKKNKKKEYRAGIILPQGKRKNSIEILVQYSSSGEFPQEDIDKNILKCLFNI